MLNIIWPVFIIISFIYAIFTGSVEVANNSIFESTQSAVQLTITLLGTMCLWNGIMKIATKTSIIDKLTKLLNPILKQLFPEVKQGSEVNKEISMNIIANIMGLGNAATPIGLKAMKSLQKENQDKKVLSNSMIMFIVLNTASLQIIPTTVIAIRNSLRFKKFHRDNCTNLDSNCNYCNLYNYCYKNIYKEKEIDMNLINYASNLAIPFTILLIITYGLIEKNKVFDTFLDGAKEGIEVVVKIFPTLIGLFVAIGLLRNSGILDFIINLISPITNFFNIPKEIMPLAILRPISRQCIYCNRNRYYEKLWSRQ